MSSSVEKRKYWSHRSNCGRKGVKPLSFDEYIKKIEEAEICADQIGVKNGDYQLSRYDDTGDYTPDSCRFITKEENLKEEIKNGGTARAAEKKRGRTKDSHPGVMAMSKKKSKEFSVKNPSGEIISGENLKEFCVKHGLNQGNIWMVIAGRKTSSLGWTKN